MKYFNQLLSLLKHPFITNVLRVPMIYAINGGKVQYHPPHKEVQVTRVPCNSTFSTVLSTVPSTRKH